MQGNTEQQQLILISQLCGSITPEVWPGVENLDLYNKMDLPKGQKRKVNNQNTRIYISFYSSPVSMHLVFYILSYRSRID